MKIDLKMPLPKVKGTITLVKKRKKEGVQISSDNANPSKMPRNTGKYPKPD